VGRSSHHSTQGYGWLLANQHRVPIHYFIWTHAEVDLDTKSQWQTIQHQESWHVNTQH